MALIDRGPIKRCLELAIKFERIAKGLEDIKEGEVEEIAKEYIELYEILNRESQGLEFDEMVFSPNWPDNQRIALAFQYARALIIVANVADAATLTKQIIALTKDIQDVITLPAEVLENNRANALM